RASRRTPCPRRGTRRARGARRGDRQSAAGRSGPAARARLRDTPRASALLARQHPLLAERPAVTHHGEAGIEALAAHHPLPYQLAVLRAFGLHREAHSAVSGGRGVGTVTIVVLIARGRAEAP